MYGTMLAVVAVFSALSATSVRAQGTPSLVHNLGLYGGEVRDIAIDSSSEYVYISTYSPNGFFISADDGLTWTGMPEGTDYGEPSGVEVTSEGRVYMLSSSGLYTSNDHGETVVGIGDFGAFGGSLAANDELIVVGRSDGQVATSADEGATWTTVQVGIENSIINDVAIGASNALFALAYDNTDALLYTSADLGETWNQIDVSETGIDPDGVLALASDPSFLIITPRDTAQHPFVSSNGGEDWTDTGLTHFNGYLTSDTNDRIYLGVRFSDDKGATWDSLNDATPTNRVSGLVVADPDDALHLFGASFGAIAISEDVGETWVDSNEGITAVTVKDIAQSVDKTTVWVATNAGLAKTTNFSEESAVTWEFPIHYEYYPESVWVDPADALHVVVGGYNAVYETEDGGDTWSTATGWDSTYAAKQIVQDPESGALYAAAAYQNFTEFKTGDVLSSVDGGMTWSSLDFTFGSAQSLVVAVDGTLFVGTGNIDLSADSPTGIYMYADSTWTHIDSSPEMEITALAIDPEDSERMYATAADFNTTGSESDTLSGFYVSEDGGVTWTRVTTGLEDATKFRTMTVQASEESTTRVYLGGANKLTSKGTIYKSINAGETFGVYYEGLSSEAIYAFLFDGLLTGNSTGAYGMQTQVKMKIAKKEIIVNGVDKMRIRATLKDKATDQPLENYRIALYRRVNHEWRLVRAKRTGPLGRVNFKVRPQKKAKYKVVFEPSTISAEEYASMWKKTRVHAFE